MTTARAFFVSLFVFASFGFMGCADEQPNHTNDKELREQLELIQRELGELRSKVDLVGVGEVPPPIADFVRERAEAQKKLIDAKLSRADKADEQTIFWMACTSSEASGDCRTAPPGCPCSGKHGRGPAWKTDDKNLDIARADGQAAVAAIDEAVTALDAGTERLLESLKGTVASVDPAVSEQLAGLEQAVAKMAEKQAEVKQVRPNEDRTIYLVVLLELAGVGLGLAFVAMAQRRQIRQLRVEAQHAASSMAQALTTARRSLANTNRTLELANEPEFPVDGCENAEELERSFRLDEEAGQSEGINRLRGGRTTRSFADLGDDQVGDDLVRGARETERAADVAEERLATPARHVPTSQGLPVLGPDEPDEIEQILAAPARRLDEPVGGWSPPKVDVEWTPADTQTLPGPRVPAQGPFALSGGMHPALRDRELPLANQGGNGAGVLIRPTPRRTESGMFPVSGPDAPPTGGRRVTVPFETVARDVASEPAPLDGEPGFTGDDEITPAQGTPPPFDEEREHTVFWPPDDDSGGQKT